MDEPTRPFSRHLMCRSRGNHPRKDRSSLPTAFRFRSVSPPAESTIRALAATFTPSLADDRAQLRRVYSNFLYVYGDLPADTRTKLAVLVRVIEAASWLRYGQSFSALSPEHRDALCRRLGDAPIPRLQAGFGGLRSLVLNATYTEPGQWERIGYAGPTVGESRRLDSEPS